MPTLVLSEIRRNLIEIIVRRLRAETANWSARTASIELDEAEAAMVREEMQNRGVSLLVEISHAIEAELQPGGGCLAISCNPEREPILHYDLDQ